MTIPTQRSASAPPQVSRGPLSRLALPCTRGTCGTCRTCDEDRVDGRRLLPAPLLDHPPLIVVMGGVIDGDAGAEVRRSLHVDARRTSLLVVLDTSAVTSIDGAGLELIRVAGATLAEAGHQLWLWAPAPAVRRALARAGLDEDLAPVAPCTGGEP